MDMWGPYIAATQKALPDPEKKIVFDKFHVAKHLGDAVDKVRREEHRGLKEAGDDTLSGTRYSWLINPDHMTEEQHARLDALRGNALRTARAWALKEFAMSLWWYKSRGWARRAWERWLSWAVRCRLEPIKRVARMV
jgi:transposase